MADDEKRTKPKYEAPTVVPLGELAQGIGTCAVVGSNPGDSSCGSGTVTTSSSCGAGGSASTSCDSNGTYAGASCNEHGSTFA